MPVDSRPDLDRLTRFELYREADAQGIQYPKDHPKYIWDGANRVVGGMVPLLQANGVNRETMKTIRWRAIIPSEQEMAAASHQGVMTQPQYYPDRSGPALDVRPKTQANPEIQALRQENEQLKSLLARLERLESKAEADEKLIENDYWTLYRKCKDAGFPVKRGIKHEELEALLRAENSTSGSQCGPE